jgi:hypothetical protein
MSKENTEGLKEKADVPSKENSSSPLTIYNALQKVVKSPTANVAGGYRIDSLLEEPKKFDRENSSPTRLGKIKRISSHKAYFYLPHNSLL